MEIIESFVLIENENDRFFNPHVAVQSRERSGWVCDRDWLNQRPEHDHRIWDNRAIHSVITPHHWYSAEQYVNYDDKERNIYSFFTGVQKEGMQMKKR